MVVAGGVDPKQCAGIQVVATGRMEERWEETVEPVTRVKIAMAGPAII